MLVVGAIIRSSPSWWKPVSSSDPSVKASGEQLENAVVSELSRARPKDNQSRGTWRSEAWTVSLSSDQATAWLNTRLPQWLRNRDRDELWPSNLDQLQASFRDGRVLLGARVRLGTSSQIVSFTLVPSVGAGGSLFLVAEGIAIGRLPVPMSALWAVQSNEQTQQIEQILSGKIPVTAEPVVNLDDGRRVRLIKLVPRGDDLEITCVTEAGG